MFTSCFCACDLHTYYLKISILRYFVKYHIDIVLKLKSWYQVITTAQNCSVPYRDASTTWGSMHNNVVA